MTVIIRPPSAILCGPPGSGKTTSLWTWLAAEKEVFVIMTETGGVDSLVDSVLYEDLATKKIRRKNGPELLSRLHWHSIVPDAANWDQLRAAVKMVGSMSFKDLKSMRPEKSPDVMLSILDTCNNFPCDRTGQKFGDVSTWDDSRVLVLDSLSGLNDIVFQLVSGFKPSPDQGEWGVMVGQQKNFLDTLRKSVKCYLVVLAHINRGNDEVTGVKEITPAAMTYNFSGKVGKDFSEVILAKRDGIKFYWTTAEAGADVKNRALPVDANIPPDWGQLVAHHNARKTATHN